MYDLFAVTTVPLLVGLLHYTYMQMQHLEEYNAAAAVAAMQYLILKSIWYVVPFTFSES